MPKYVDLGTRGFPRRSLARPGARVLAKGSKCRKGNEISAVPFRSLDNPEMGCAVLGHREADYPVRSVAEPQVALWESRSFPKCYSSWNKRLKTTE